MTKFYFVLFFTPAVFCQSILLDKGTTSISGAYSFASNDVITNSGAAFIFSLSGVLDAGIDYSEAGLLSVLSYTIRRDSTPGGISFSAGYFADESGNGGGPIAAITAGIRLLSNEKLALLSVVGISYAFYSSRGSGINDSRALTFELPFRYINNKFGFFVSPAFAYDLERKKNEFVFGFSTGLLVVLN
ncbi:MAG: hypothetical protein R6W90_04775 [Ignavibacteriaceae bacterium]